MTELDRGKLPDSRWFWLLLLIGLFVMVVFWFVNPLGNPKRMAGANPPALTTDAPAAQGSSVPLTLPTSSP